MAATAKRYVPRRMGVLTAGGAARKA